MSMFDSRDREPPSDIGKEGYGGPGHDPNFPRFDGHDDAGNESSFRRSDIGGTGQEDGLYTPRVGVPRPSRRAALQMAWHAVKAAAPASFVLTPAAVSMFEYAKAQEAYSQLQSAERYIATGRIATAGKFYATLAAINQAAGTPNDDSREAPDSPDQRDAVLAIAAHIANTSLKSDPLGALRYALHELGAHRERNNPSMGSGKNTIAEYFIAAGLAKSDDTSGTDPEHGDLLTYLQVAQDTIACLHGVAALTLQRDSTAVGRLISVTSFMGLSTGVDGNIMDKLYSYPPGEDPSSGTVPTGNVGGVLDVLVDPIMRAANLPA